MRQIEVQGTKQDEAGQATRESDDGTTWENDEEKMWENDEGMRK